MKYMNLYNLFKKYYLKFHVDADVEYFAKHFNEPSDSQILEVGANDEPIANILSLVGHDVVGVDLRDYNESLRGGLPLNFHFLKGDFNDMDFNGEFDAVVSTSTIEHLGLEDYGATRYPEDNGDILAMQNIWKVLRDGGHAYITVPVGFPYTGGNWRVYSKRLLKERVIGDFTVMQQIFFASGGFTLNNIHYDTGDLLDEKTAFNQHGPETTTLLILEKKTRIMPLSVMKRSFDEGKCPFCSKVLGWKIDYER